MSLFWISKLLCEIVLVFLEKFMLLGFRYNDPAKIYIKHFLQHDVFKRLEVFKKAKQ